MNGLVVSKQQFVITLGNMLPDATIPWIEMVYDLTQKAGLLLLDKKALRELLKQLATSHCLPWQLFELEKILEGAEK